MQSGQTRTRRKALIDKGLHCLHFLLYQVQAHVLALDLSLKPGNLRFKLSFPAQHDRDLVAVKLLALIEQARLTLQNLADGRMRRRQRGQLIGKCRRAVPRLLALGPIQLRFQQMLLLPQYFHVRTDGGITQHEQGVAFPDSVAIYDEQLFDNATFQMLNSPALPSGPILPTATTPPANGIVTLHRRKKPKNRISTPALIATGPRIEESGPFPSTPPIGPIFITAAASLRAR